VDIFAEARDAFLEAADREGAAEAETYGASALLRTGRGLEAVDQGRSAVRLLEGLPPSRPKTRVLANLARLLVITGSHEEGLVRAEEALASAHELGIPELEAHALNTIGLGRLLLGKPDAIEPLEESLWIALQHGSPYELMRIYNNLDAGYTWAGQMEDAAAATTAVVQLAERLGLPVTNPLLADAANALLLGRWDDARQRIADVGSSNDPDMHEEMLMMLVADFALATGDVVSARDAVERALVSTREDEDVAETRALLRALLCFAAHIELAAGDVPKANELTDELLSVKIEWARQFPINRIDLALLLLDLDRVEEVELPSTPAAGVDPWRHICDVIVRGQLEVAADRLAELGLRPLEAETRLRAARRLLDEGRRAEADVQLQRALAFWREVGATAYVRNAEVLLAATA
jgi:hypothetical protein